MSRWFAPVFAVLVLSGLGGCVTPQSVQEPNITLQNVKFLKAEGFVQYMEVEMLVANPNDFKIPLTGLKFGLQMNGTDFAEGITEQRVVIPKLGQAVVPVRIKVNMGAVMRQIRVAQGRKGVGYRIAGTAFLDHLLLPSVDFAREGSIRLVIKGRQKGFKVL